MFNLDSYVLISLASFGLLLLLWLGFYKSSSFSFLSRGRNSIAILDTKIITPSHKITLLQFDGQEYLILLGPHHDTLLEKRIYHKTSSDHKANSSSTLNAFHPSMESHPLND